MLATLLGPAHAAPHRLCVPPIFEGGQRLHELPSPSVSWLQLLLRQHEICWRAPAEPGELRVFLYGNSAIFGLPLPVGETAGARLNAHFAATHVPARIFNLGMVASYQLKDALIMHESLRYRPGLIVYSVTLSDFIHGAPMLWSSLIELFHVNSREVIDFAREGPAGLAEPLEIYRSRYAQPAYPFPSTLIARFRQVGALVRTAVRQHALAVRRQLLPNIPPPHFDSKGQRSHYDCAAVQRASARQFSKWQEWNILAYLQQIRDQTGIPIVVVNWPVAHEPVGDCYSFRYTNAVFQEYNDWLGRETTARGFYYVDLHDLLPPEDFVDSMHVTARGHGTIADRLGAALDPLLLQLAKQGTDSVRGAPDAPR